GLRRRPPGRSRHSMARTRLGTRHQGQFHRHRAGRSGRGLRSLASLYPELDLARVGVTGWSFGGYFSAMAAIRRPDVFKAGVAGAPVVDWRDYDTFYTERYMG